MRDYYKGFLPISECFTPALKMWMNGIPLKADTYKSCSNLCTYCFARDSISAIQEANRVKYDPRICRGMDFKQLKHVLFDKLGSGDNPFLEWAIINHKYIELGTIGETFQEIDLKYGLTYSFLQLTMEYLLPLFINTKMNLLTSNEIYYNILADYPAPVILCPTLTTTDDTLAKKIEPFAPPPSQRLKTIKRFSDDGIPSVIYTAPFLPGITDNDLEGYIHDIIEAGAKALHLRNFYFVAKLHNRKYWHDYYTKNKELFKGDRLKSNVMLDIAKRMQNIANKYSNDFIVTGVKTSWFDMPPYHGKINFDGLGKKYMKPLVDFTLLPLLREIRKKKDTPQVLYWDKIGYSENGIEYPQFIKLQELGACALITTTCTYGKRPRMNYVMPGYKWIKGSIWSGLVPDVPSGRISTIGHIYPVSKNNGFYRVSDDPQDFVYTYVPPHSEDLLIEINGIKSIPYETADSFIETKRPRDSSDKTYTLEELKKL